MVTKKPQETPDPVTGSLDELSWEQLVEQLDGVVRQLEAGELGLEESLRAFERGVQIAQAAERRLDAAEQRVELLLQGDRTRPLPPPEAEGARVPGNDGPEDEDDDVPF